LFGTDRASVLLLQSFCFRQVLTSFVFGATGSRCFSRLHPGELPVSPEKPLKLPESVCYNPCITFISCSPSPMV
ncbi:hypothetical protein K0F54_17790, partial [Bacteroides fragilis]|nr:hypothetical protein [Bacteroides fragilis]